ncbi:MAG: tRNA (adenine-N1)-methyltransferase [Candidatus Ratteibacteria bacterium]
MKKITIFCDGKKWLIDKNIKTFSTHFGNINIPENIDGVENCVINKKKFYFYEPTISEFILKIKRKTQIIYPKDIALIIFYSDLKETDNVIEVGTGSGALLIGILSRVKIGKIITIERNEEFRKIAEKNLENYFDKIPENLEFILGDVYDENFKLNLEEKWADKIFLDIPEPWKAKKILKYLKTGGILVNYNPQITQIKKFIEEIEGFIDIEVFELLERKWIVDEKRARPSDLMRAHTGFIMMARKVE